MSIKTKLLLVVIPLSIMILDFINLGNSQTKAVETKINHLYEIDCDSIYPTKGYKISIERLNSYVEDEDINNALFVFSQQINNETHILFEDSIYNIRDEILFEDFNGDQIPDILIHHTSDVRSNEMYYLYQIDTTKNQLRKILGFNKVKNPNYLPEYDLISNYVISGRIWTSFYKISGDSIIDFDIVIYDDQLDDGSYEKGYKNTINEILEYRIN